MMLIFKLLFLIFVFILVFPGDSISQNYIFTPKENVVKVTEVYPPSNGFVKKGDTKTHTNSGNTFYININEKTFKWKDKKGTNTENIFDIIKSSDLKQIVFKTQYNAIRLTFSQYNPDGVIEIISSINGQWICMSYLCNINDSN